MHALTKEELKALRTAGDVVLRYHEGVGTLEANKRFDPKDGFGPRELKATVAVETIFSLFADDGNGVDHDVQCRSAFAMVHSSGYSEEWQTIAHALRAGDMLTLHWIANNNGGVVRDAGLATDSVSLIVTRGDGQGKGRNRLKFAVDHSVALKYSTNRMVHTEPAQAFELNA